MAQHRFILKSPNSDKETQVYLHFYFNYFEVDKNGKKKYKRLTYYTGEKIHPKFWNQEKGRARETKKFKQYSEFNASLKAVEDAVYNLYRKLKNDGIQPTPELLNQKLREHFGKVNKPGKAPEKENFTLFEFIDKYIQESESNKSKTTLSVYNTTYDYLKRYQEYKNLNKLNFEDITLDFYYDFTDFLRTQLTYEKDGKIYKKKLSENTIGKYIKTLKTFLNEASERGYNKYSNYKSKRFKVSQEDTEQVYLTEDELMKIYDLDLSENKKLDRVRDLFIIAAYTALRFSDINQVKSENIIKNGTQLKIRTHKTGEPVVIPLHWTVKEIFEKHNHNVPDTISNQKMNQYIKDICRMAEINQSINKRIKKGGMTVNQKFEKYQLVSTHTARRSGATNMYLAGIPTISIMKITGHKTEKAFLRYIRISPEENADKLMNHEFFNSNLRVAK
jgi:integrase